MRIDTQRAVCRDACTPAMQQAIWTYSTGSPSSERSIPAHSRCQHWVLAKLSPIDELLEHSELGIFGHIGRSPGCDVDTTGPMPYRLDYEYCGFKETPYSLDREDSDERGHVLWLSITRRCNVAVTRRTVGCRAVTRRTVGRGRLKVPSSGLGWELSRTGSKHDGIKARRENPKSGKNPNFGIMKFFEEAGDSGNIFHQACVAAHAIGSMRADTQSLRSPSSKRSIPAHSRCQHCVLAKLSLIDKLLEHCELGIFGHIGRSPGCDVDTTGSMPHDGEDRILPIERMNTKSPGPKLECCVVLVYCVELALLCCVGGYGTLESVLAPRYGVISDRIVGYFGLSGLATRFWVEVASSMSDLTRTGLGRRVNFMTLTGLFLARHVALPDHGVGLDGQSCSCLIVDWPVGLSSPTLGVGHPSVMFLFDCWPVGRPMPRTVWECYRGGIRAWLRLCLLVPVFSTFSIIFKSKGVANALSRKSGRVQSLGRGCCTGVVGWISGVMEDFDVLPSPTLADLFAPQDFDQIIIISDDDTESDDDVLEIPSVAPPSPITIWSTGTTGETPSYDPAEDHGPSPPTPDVGMLSWSPPLEAFELPISPMSQGLPDLTYIPMTDEQYELETGWLTLFYQPMESIGDSEDDPTPYYPDMMITDDPFIQPIELPHYQPIFETGEPSSFPHAEAATMELPFPEIIYDIGEPSSFPYMETATTELPLPT
ncbi:hypothetical protein DY000_02022536 [Brassica cretica]|uniref:Uncharacterized protein n=1 Tax=Brassica cretica TaxID=69181 RepID=A0ABQ7E2Y2_BRACR|nr:hypothetical protein DY000_02022536 [Brassica cretica]